MNYVSEYSNQSSHETMFHDDKENLENEIARLTEWKHKATVQLEHFRIACSIYNFCDAQQLNELLNR